MGNVKINHIILALIGSLFAICAFAQVPQYGDLELSVLGTNGLEVKAIDPDLQDTTFNVTVNSIAFFEDLYIYTTVGMAEKQKSLTPSLQGNVRFYDMQGNMLGQRKANEDGTVLWNGAGKTTEGIFLLQDEKGRSLKFIYLNKPCLLGKNNAPGWGNTFKNIQDNSNIYEIWADGRYLEWEPFDVIIEEHELFADIINYVMMFPEPLADGPATGQVEILVNGEAAGDNSEVKIVRTGQSDTAYIYTTDGIAVFDEAVGITSHPFGNFTRDYTILINAFNANSNWFHAEIHEVDMALGPGNNFVFTPEPVTDEERTANVTLEIIIDGTTPAAENAEVKVYRLGETDTTFAYTNDQGIAQLDCLVHPFQADAHQFAINSDGCTSNFFYPLVEAHNLFVGQNDIEMNPDPVAQNFAEGLIETLYNNGGEDNVEVKIWRLNNTIDTVIYFTNAAGRFYYENLPIEGSSSDYVFKSFKAAGGGNPTLTSIDTFNLVPNVNPMHTAYLEAISQFITMSGTIREFYTQSTEVAGVGMEVREPNGGATIGTATTDANGDYVISGIPANAETEIVMTGLANHFHRIHAYTFHGVFVPADTLLEGMNMLHVPYDWTIPQTANDPAPATIAVDEGLIFELVGSDSKNAEKFLRNEKRIHLINFYTPNDSAYAFAIEAAIDSLFWGGQGSPIVFVSNPINITTYHILNYNYWVGFPEELGYNVQRGGGNHTALEHSSVGTGYYILGGEINITGSTGDLSSGVKEFVGRGDDWGDTGTLGMMYTGQSTLPNHTERAYHTASRINLIARDIDGYETFSFRGISTSTKSR